MARLLSRAVDLKKNDLCLLCVSRGAECGGSGLCEHGRERRLCKYRSSYKERMDLCRLPAVARSAIAQSWGRRAQPAHSPPPVARTQYTVSVACPGVNHDCFFAHRLPIGA